jgi:hypothetical protein
VTTLRLDITGNPKSVPYRSFIDMANNSLAILSDLDPRFSHRQAGNVEWYMNNLSLNGALRIEVYSKVRTLKTKILADVSRQVAGSFVRGFGTLEKEGRSPEYFTSYGMDRAAEMTRVIGHDKAHAIVAEVLEDEAAVEITESSVRNLKELIPESYRAIGSVEGTLEAISIHGRKRSGHDRERLLFVVYESLFGKAVTCRLSGIPLVEKVKDSLGKRVRVSGLVSRNARSEPRQVMLYRPEDLEVFGEDLRVLRFRSLGGSDPDFTGELSTEDFIRSVRG